MAAAGRLHIGSVLLKDDHSNVLAGCRGDRAQAAIDLLPHIAKNHAPFCKGLRSGALDLTLLILTRVDVHGKHLC